MDSSRGRNLTLGRMTRRIFRHMGMTMTMVSTDKTRPAPREIQTENWRALRGARRASPCCFHLQLCQRDERTFKERGNLPSNAEYGPVETPKEKVESELLWRKKPIHD